MLNDIKKSINAHHIKLEGKNKITAVLLPLIKVNDELHILFEVRSFNLNSQPGEICLPGGKKEDGELPVLSALRETMEELNLEESQIEIFGGIDTIVTPFNLVVHPYVGSLEIDDIDEINCNEDEVDHIFTIPLQYFINNKPEVYNIKNYFEFPLDFPYEKIPKEKDYPWKEGIYPICFYEYGDYVIWGITAKIINNFINIIKGLS